MNRFLTFAIAGLLSQASIHAQASAPSFVNGSFEDPTIAGLSWQYPESLPGWTAVTSLDTFNIHGDALWPSQDGSQHIEFDSTVAVLSQTLSGFVVGVSYQLIFGLAGNPDRPAEYKLQATVSDSNATLVSAEFSFDSTGYTRSNVGWVDQSVKFTATNETLNFIFARTDSGPTGWGPELDNVRISASPAPEPQTYGLFAVGLFVVIGQFKRRQAGFQNRKSVS